MMKIKKLDLWEINKQAFKVCDKFTSVLSQRAGIKSKLFPILYSSREQSLERITTSPGVSRILNKNSIEEKSNKECIKICDSNEYQNKKSIITPRGEKILSQIQKCRENSLETNKTCIESKLKLKNSRSMNKLWKGYSLKFTDGLMPVRQSQKTINRESVTRLSQSNIQALKCQRVKIDISNPSSSIQEAKKKPLRNVKGKKHSMPFNSAYQTVSKTKMITLDIKPDEVKFVETSKERTCESSNSSIERNCKFIESMSTASILKAKDSNIKHRVREPKINTDSYELLALYDSRTSKNSDFTYKSLASYQKPTASSKRKVSKAKNQNSSKNKENKKLQTRNCYKNDFNSIENSCILKSIDQSNKSKYQYSSFAETEKPNKSTMNLKQCKSSLKLLEKYSNSINKNNRLNTCYKNEFNKYQTKVKMPKQRPEPVKCTLVLPDPSFIENFKQIQFNELKVPNVIEVNESLDENDDESFEHISAAHIIKSKFDLN